MAAGDDVVIFGAGDIGRGLLGQLVADAGLHPVFVEADADLVRRLADAGVYRVHLVGRTQAICHIADFGVLGLDEPDLINTVISGCRFAATAVGGQNLPEVGPVLAAALAVRAQPLNVVVCENLPHAAEILGQSVNACGPAGARLNCVRASVERMVRSANNSLDLIGERGESLYVDRSAWLGVAPDIAGMILCDDIDSFYDRKLFTNNAGHALLAYIGALWGCQFIHEAVEIAEIRQHLRELLDLAGTALVRRYGMDAAEMYDHLDCLVHWRFANRELADSVRRVGRDPLRKLGPEERLIGLIRLLQSCGLPTTPVCRVVGAALHYSDSDDQESVCLQEMILREGPEIVLTSVCGLNETEPVFEESLRFYADYSN